MAGEGKVTVPPGPSRLASPARRRLRVWPGAGPQVRYTRGRGAAGGVGSGSPPRRGLRQGRPGPARAAHRGAAEGGGRPGVAGAGGGPGDAGGVGVRWGRGRRWAGVPGLRLPARAPLPLGAAAARGLHPGVTHRGSTAVSEAGFLVAVTSGQLAPGRPGLEWVKTVP